MKRNAGFTLVEVLVAIVLLGALVIPVSSGMIMTLRMNEKTEEMMQAQLAVSSAVETMMAKGITVASDDYTWYESANPYPGLTVKTIEVKETKDGVEITLPYYIVKVTYEVDGEQVIDTVTTTIRKAGG